MVVDPSPSSKVPFGATELPHGGREISRLGMLVQLHVDGLSTQREEVTSDGCLAAICRIASVGRLPVTPEAARQRFGTYVEGLGNNLQYGVESPQYRAAAYGLIGALISKEDQEPTPPSQQREVLPPLQVPVNYRPEAEDEGPANVLSPNKSALIDHVARFFDTPLDRRTAALITDAVLAGITSLLCSHDEARIKGFGTFVARDRKGRTYVHPLTGEEIDTPDKRKVLFFPSDNLNDKVRIAYEQRTETPKK